MHRYYLGLKELDEAIGGIGGGANILLIGPPMCGKEYLMKAILMAGLSAGEAVIVTENRVPAATFLNTWGAGQEARIGVVDCITRCLGGNVEDTVAIRYTSGPIDLTGVGVRINQMIDGYLKSDVMYMRLCIDSLSTILMYSDLQTVFRFMHMFTGRVLLAKTLGIYLVDEGMHDDRTISTLKQLFTGVLEVRSHDGRYMVRAVGLTPRPTPWFEYEADGGSVIFRGTGND